MEPEAVIEAEFAWFGSEAGSLKYGPQEKVRSALRNRPIDAATKLYDLLRSGELPTHWEPHIDNLWGAVY